MVNKHAGLTALTIIMLLVAPAIVSAQVFPFNPGGAFAPTAPPEMPGGHGPAPGFPLAPAPNYQPGPQSGPVCGPGGPCPPVPCGPMRPCETPMLLDPTVYAGYLYKDRGVGLKFDAEGGQNLAGLTNFRHDYDLNGIWLQLLLPVQITEGFCLTLGGSHLFPIDSSSEETNGQSREVYTFVAGVQSDRRNWDTDIQWWNVTAAATMDVFDPVKVIGGFRWDSFMTNFSDPTLPAVGTVAGGVADEADVTVNQFLPFFGSVVTLPVTCESVVKGSALFFPTMIGDWKYGQTLGAAVPTPARIMGEGTFNSGYFLETMLEAVAKYDNATIGAFCKVEWAHGKSNETLSIPFVGGLDQAFPPAEFEVEIDRRHWVWGLRASYALTMPSIF